MVTIEMTFIHVFQDTDMTGEDVFLIIMIYKGEIILKQNKFS